MSDNAGTLNIQNVKDHLYMGKASASGAMTFAKVSTRQMSSQGVRRTINQRGKSTNIL